MIDFLIQNATVCTGLLEKSKVFDVGIQGDKIVVFEENEKRPDAKEVIDATGWLLLPGFIDPHASTGFGYFFPKAADHKLFQGITTEIFGNCGTSPGPIGPNLEDTMHKIAGDIGFTFDWNSLGEFFDRIKDKLQFNVATLVGHSTLRGGFMEDWKTLTPEAMTAMKTSLAKAMDEGALGLSTGLIYAPGCFAEMDEIVELAKVAASKGGIYASHIRNERNEVEAAITEALEISEQANIRTLISHLKAAEQQNWGKIPGILKQVESFNEKHPDLQAAVDVYPYTAVSTKLRAFIPNYILKEGIANIPQKLKDPKAKKDIEAWIEKRKYDLTQMMIISDKFEEYFGKTVAQIADEKNLSETETMIEILTKDTEAWIIYHSINQDDIDTIVGWNKSMICTDSWSYPINGPISIGQPHPRSYGAFTAYLERYVLNEKSLAWEEAIHKITYLPAKFFNLKKRGQIKSGYYADLVLMNPDTLKNNATYTAPRSLSTGVEYLWVNGKRVIENQKINDLCPGKVLTLKE